jgi:predicted phage terminase large subunit-like protein
MPRLWRVDPAPGFQFLAAVMTLPELYIPGCPHRPTVKQWAALSIFYVRELLYGGAAGGGKSDFLLMAALQFIDQPGYSAIIFRRTFPQLAAPEDGLLARAQEWLAPDPAFDGVDTIHGMPTRWKYKGGGTLSFSHMQYERDKYNHQGPSYQFIGWDELTQFTESQYTYLMSRLRRLEGSSVPLRVRSASNPGGEGHDWVKARLVAPENPTEDCLFIPAKLEDNEHVDAEEYRPTLMLLHPFEQRQLLEGDWDARPPGSRFRREWFPIVEQTPVKFRKTVRYWDLAATEPKPGKDPDWTVGVKMGVTHEGIFYVLDVQRFRTTPAGIDARILQTAQIDGRETPIKIEQEGGASGKIAAAHFLRLLAGFTVRCKPVTGDKVVRSNPVASQAEAGNYRLVRGPWNEDYLRVLEMFPNGSHDDDVDGTSGAQDELTSRGPSFADLYGPPVEEETHAEPA